MKRAAGMGEVGDGDQPVGASYFSEMIKLLNDDFGDLLVRSVNLAMRNNARLFEVVHCST